MCRCPDRHKAGHRRTAREFVVTRAAVQRVVALVAPEDIVAALAEEFIGHDASEEPVFAVAAVQALETSKVANRESSPPSSY